jgi:hypothetical protein
LTGILKIRFKPGSQILKKPLVPVHTWSSPHVEVNLLNGSLKIKFTPGSQILTKPLVPVDTRNSPRVKINLVTGSPEFKLKPGSQIFKKPLVPLPTRSSPARSIDSLRNMENQVQGSKQLRFTAGAKSSLELPMDSSSEHKVSPPLL